VIYMGTPPGPPAPSHQRVILSAFGGNKGYI
jgi:hypothetical protein